VPRQTKLQKSEKYRQLIKGVRKHWMKGGSMVFAQKTYTPGQVVDELQSFIDEQDRTAQARAAWRDQVKRERALEKKLGPLVSGIEYRVGALYKKDGTERSDFGIRKGKPGPKTLSVKAEMVVKAAATRKARGTKGKRQRSKIKG
jgi:hypothetical protein